MVYTAVYTIPCFSHRVIQSVYLHGSNEAKRKRREPQRGKTKERTNERTNERTIAPLPSRDSGGGDGKSRRTTGSGRVKFDTRCRLAVSYANLSTPRENLQLLAESSEHVDPTCSLLVYIVLCSSGISNGKPSRPPSSSFFSFAGNA